MMLPSPRYLARSALVVLMLLVLLVAVLMVTLTASGPAAAKRVAIPQPPILNAASWLLADANSGQIIVQHRADLPLPPASLTKVMTGYVIADQIKRGQASLDDTIKVSRTAHAARGSRMFIELGSSVEVRDLVNGLVVHSGNDASVALAEYIAGSEPSFVTLMNQYAGALDMTNTYFLNSTGWPTDGHRSTANDLYKLTRSLILDYPEHYRLYSKKVFSYGIDRRTGQPIRQFNRNKMLWDDNSVDGVKTGHTEEAGYCLIVSAERNGMRLISVVMSAPDESGRLESTRTLLSHGFRFYESQLILEAGKAIQPPPKLWGGLTDDLQIGIAETAWVTIPKGDKEALVPELHLNEDSFWAPVSEGDELGVLRTTLEGRVLHEAPVIALESVDQSGLVARLFDRVSFFFSSTF